MNKSINSLSVIIPIYNEEKILSKVVHKVIDNLKKIGLVYEILLIENGSTDNSFKICKKLQYESNGIRAIHLDERNYGLALKYGFLAAKNRLMVNFSVDWVDFDFLSNAIHESPKYDIILSSKNMFRGLDKRSISRVWGGRVFHLLVNWLIKVPFSDTHGIRLLKRKKITKLLRQCRMGGEMFETEMLVRAYRQGLSVLELPIKVQEFRPPRVNIFKRGSRGLIQLMELKIILHKEEIYAHKKQ